MKSLLVGRAAMALALATAVPGIAYAQWTPGSEIVGQSVQVTTNGVTNTVYLDPGGTARIMTPAGNTVPGTWTAAGGQLCLSAGGPTECWPYTAPFQAGAPVSLTSNCNSTSTWLASATNTPPPPPPVERGERGR
jgi:hypothetical protein